MLECPQTFLKVRCLSAHPLDDHSMVSGRHTPKDDVALFSLGERAVHTRRIFSNRPVVGAQPENNCANTCAKRSYSKQTQGGLVCNANIDILWKLPTIWSVCVPYTVSV